MSWHCSSCLWGSTFLSWLASVVVRLSLPVQSLILGLQLQHGLRTFWGKQAQVVTGC